jgi:hypothetical protein
MYILDVPNRLIFYQSHKEKFLINNCFIFTLIFSSITYSKKSHLIIDDSFGYELLTLAPAMSAEEPIEMRELGDAISRRARFFSALDQFWICSFPAATSSPNLTNPRSMWNPNGQHWHFSTAGGLPTIICCSCCGGC